MDRIDVGLEVKFADDAPDGMFSGYGAVFDNIDSFGDKIVKGAFRDTLREWKKLGVMPPMLLQHGGFMGPLDDEMPIGVWTSMEEDDLGLKVEGQLAIKTPRGSMVHELMRMKPKPALNGLSIGFRARKTVNGTKPDEPRRTLQAVELIELSIVTMPANPKARVKAVKAADRIATIREFEAFLRDAGGYSNAAAKAIAARGFKPSEPRDEDEQALADIAAILERNAALFNPNQGA
jgi:HK97 family phage prohead protease